MLKVNFIFNSNKGFDVADDPDFNPAEEPDSEPEIKKEVIIY